MQKEVPHMFYIKQTFAYVAIEFKKYGRMRQDFAVLASV
jgi:hypothetical protein